MTGEKSLLSEPRLRHLAIAFAVALLLGVVGFVGPLNGVIWAVQARALQHQASGDIVFIGVDRDAGDFTAPEARRQLADVIERLTAAGARRIFVDIDLEQPGSERADGLLNRAARQSGRVVFVDRYATRGASERLVSPAPSVSRGLPSVIRKEPVELLGFTWRSPYAVRIDGGTYPSFPAALADRQGPPNDTFFIDYSTSYSSIPAVTMREARQLLAVPPQARTFSGKTIVIGTIPREGAASAAIPGFRNVPVSYIGIFAAETLKHGKLLVIDWYFPVFLVAIILGFACFSPPSWARRTSYAAAAAAVPSIFLASLWMGWAVELVEAIVFLFLFGAIRLWVRFYRRAPLVNILSGLPTFEKLERDLVRNRGERPAVVVAKIHRFDEVLASLPRERHGDYMQQIAARLKVADEALTIYSSGGRYFAWLQQSASGEQLHSHLVGLRALFSSALKIDDLSVDVGITFGADASDEPNAGKRISSALAAVDKTSEASNAVVLANQASDDERRWNISLQARLDEAMKTNEIYLVYQPQFDLTTGRMFGAEALARWNDPERGEIPPSYFIEQCEQVGRMHALTTKVFREAIAAVSESPFAGMDFNLSMNVSATQLNDFEIVRLLEQTLAGSRIAPSNVTIEMTETARIADLDRASVVLSHLKQLGVRLSADDFGVGAASFEPFLQLPFDELKIDRVFVSRVKTDVKASKIVESLVRLGKDLNVLVLAEGVEDEATIEALRALGCRAAQGYKLGRPMTLESAYHAWVAAGGGNASMERVNV